MIVYNWRMHHELILKVISFPVYGHTRITISAFRRTLMPKTLELFSRLYVLGPVWAAFLMED